MQNYLGNAKRENVEDLRGRGGGLREIYPLH